ncbi:MAG: zf-TFIIB domain-containing protein [Bacteroidota bacterium]
MQVILIARGEQRICPAGGATLVKEAGNELVIDSCPQCKGIWLDAGELEAIKEVASEEGMSTGMIMGILT